MMKISINDYEVVLDYVINFINKLPNDLSPPLVIQNGHIKNPGISDIDLVIGFNDDFISSSKFLYLFKKEIKKIKNNNIFFHHLPKIYPLSSLKLLPSMTYNPKEELKIIKGTINFQESDCNEYQNILNSFEEIHNRIVMLATLLLKKDKNINPLLLIGHSLIHTIDCINKIGGNFNSKNFIHFLKVEEIRNEITLGNNSYNYDHQSLCKGLLDEFFLMLRWINKYFEKKINIHFSKSKNIHQYDNEIILTNLNLKSINPKFSLNDNKLLIDGFSWQSKCIFENYFKKDLNYKTLFLDSKLKKEIIRRVNFIKSFCNFNFKNFGHAVGRTGLHPLIKNHEYNQLAREL